MTEFRNSTTGKLRMSVRQATALSLSAVLGCVLLCYHV